MNGPASDARLAAALLAVDPQGLGGMHLRARASPDRTAFVEAFRALLPAGTPFRRLPAGISEDRLIGGLDLAATLASGRRTIERGVLPACDGGVAIVPMAERLAPTVVAHLCRALDTGEVAVERDGASHRLPAHVAVLALDEGIDEEAIAAPLADRLAFSIDLDAVRAPPDDGRDMTWRPDDVAAARSRLAGVAIRDDLPAALCITAEALGVASVRAVLAALRASRAHAALDGRGEADEADAAAAARLVLAPRATRLPPVEAEAPAEADPPPPAPPDQDGDEGGDDRPMADRIVEAARAAIPADVLAVLAGGVRRRAGGADGRQGLERRSPRSGRPAGTRAGLPRDGARLAIVDTLRAAAPRQGLRRGGTGDQDGRIAVRSEDFRIRRFVRPDRTVTIFVVDASGSTALARLAEAKGAVELMLAQAYVRRDEVALLAVRGRAADLVLPPTRSLTRARRALSALPGGGGTPLAAGIDAAAALARSVRRRGATPLLVFLTDGQANVCRDGSGGRERARAEAASAARVLRGEGFAAVLIDSAARPERRAADLAREMSARYLPLPNADAAAIARAVENRG